MRWLLHPLLFGLYPILSYAAHNRQELELALILQPIIASLVLVLLVWLVTHLLIRSKNRSAVYASLFALVFFAYGHVTNLLDQIEGLYWEIAVGSGVITLGPDKILFPIVVMLLITSLGWMHGTKRQFKTVTKMLSFVSIGLVSIPLIVLIPHQIEVMKNSDFALKHSLKPAKYMGGTPDIYYLIFDRYAHNLTLQEMYGFDNSEFTNYLTEKGFYVVEESKSNYPKTSHSLASSLNFRYLGEFSEQIGEESSDLLPLGLAIEDNQLVQFLKGSGYSYYHLGSWWAETQHNQNATKSYIYQPMGLQIKELNLKLMELTMLKPVLSLVGTDKWETELSFHGRARATTLYQLENLNKIAKIKGPKFIFAHVLMPHDPYVFDRDGNYKSGDEEAQISTVENYLEQLQYTNKRIRELVDNIMINSPTPPIIIIQADEGPHPLVEKEGKHVDAWEEATESELNEKFRILNAIYYPDQDYAALYPTVTPVNTFRLVLNKYFSSELPILPDKSYIYPDDDHYYRFVDVTGKIKFGK